jgi:hypothetical protein
MAGASRRSSALLLLAVLASYPASLLVAFLATSFATPDVPPVTEIPEEEVVSEFPDPPPPPAGPAHQGPPLPKIDPGTPLAGLLPTPPKLNQAPVYLGGDLAGVPELKLEAAPPAEKLTTEQWTSRKAHAAAAALHLNGGEEDGFLKALVRSRADLAGLPFLMGDACRTKGGRAKAFKDVAQMLGRGEEARFLAGGPKSGPAEEKRQQYRQAHAAVVAQVLPAVEAPGQQALTRVLGSNPRPEATRELARVAVFSPEKSVRAEAIKALVGRGPRDSTDVLVAGLRYPWPAVAENAARAIVDLARKDLVPQLEALLDEADPRGPRTEVVGGREVTVAHEVVRINHHRNCMLCHAPAESGKTPEETLVADVPLPSLPLPPSGLGYGGSSPASPSPKSNLLVRIDVTYLRQDFSAVQPVYDASAWRVTQRFDFVVRKRVLTPDEADDLRARLAGASPYRRSAALALLELTGRGVGPGL